MILSTKNDSKLISRLEELERQASLWVQEPDERVHAERYGLDPYLPPARLRQLLPVEALRELRIRDFALRRIETSTRLINRQIRLLGGPLKVLATAHSKPWSNFCEN